MAKTITLRVTDEQYNQFKMYAELDNRPLSNFLETAAIYYIQEHEYVESYEMSEIGSNLSLNKSIKRGIQNVKKAQGRFVEG